MEIRTLRYFLETARGGKHVESRRAPAPFPVYPLLKQLKNLEDELGKKLFVRHSFSIELTEEGMLLRKRAERSALHG